MKYTQLKTIAVHASGRHRIILLFILTAMVLFPAVETRASWGDLDTRFGFQGVTVDPITGYFPQSVAIQPDGKILVTGYRNTIFGNNGFFLRRYLANGQLDTSFGNDGAAIVSNPYFRNADYEGKRIVVQADGKISVGGWVGTIATNGSTQGSYAVWQFTSAGLSDTAFGDNGLKVLTKYSIVGYTAPELYIQNGKLLLSLPKPMESGSRLALTRLTSTGAIDSSFGTFGESSTNLRGYGFGTFVEPTNEKITVSGVPADDAYSVVLERKTASGQTDPTFLPTPAPRNGIPTGLVKLANGKFTIKVGDLGGYYALTLLSFGSNGGYDSSVPLSFEPAGTPRCPYVFASQNNGKLLITELSKIYRLDPDLNAGTMEVYDCSNISGASWSARPAIQSDDKMVAAGTYNGNLILVRLLPN